MDNKVSMVVACYNKEDYISEMLESIYNQIWDNIEVVIVNDGSTDNTFGIILDWKIKLIARGYEVIVINQKNKGVAAALKIGLESATGDYVCFPDCDDELSPEYVSAMANELKNRNDIDFVACKMGIRNERGGSYYTSFVPSEEFEKEDLLKRFLLLRLPITLCIYLFKHAYLKSVGLPKNVITISSETQEPQFLIPIFNGGGKCKRVDKTLYINNIYARNLTNYFIKDPMRKIMIEYHQLQLKTISLLPISVEEKLSLASLANMGVLQISSHQSKNSFFDDIRLNAISKIILQEKRCIYDISRCKRIIAYGSLGENATRLLPFLKDTVLWPNIFWDRAANENSYVFDGSKVVKPSPKLLNQDDLIICFPLVESLINEVSLVSEEKGALFMNYFNILDWLSELYCC